MWSNSATAGILGRLRTFQTPQRGVENYKNRIRLSMRRLTFPAVLLAAALVLSAFPAFAQTPFSTTIQPEWLKQVLPTAETFSDKAGDPPVYSGFRNNPETG